MIERFKKFSTETPSLGKEKETYYVPTLYFPSLALRYKSTKLPVKRVKGSPGPSTHKTILGKSWSVYFPNL